MSSNIELKKADTEVALHFTGFTSTWYKQGEEV